MDNEWDRVLNVNTSAVVIAPPGGRKTTLLTEKVRKELKNKARILCLVFTRRDADTLRERIQGDVVVDDEGAMWLPPQVDISTIHAFCHKHVGWSGDYDKMLLDFKKLPDIDKYDWVFIDEAQDLNQTELDCALKVADKVFAVGDPYQSIFGFQGALADDTFYQIERARKAEWIELHDNYRSNPEVIKQFEFVHKRNLVSKHVTDTGITHAFFLRNIHLRTASDYLKSYGIAHTVRIAQAVDSRKEYTVLGKSNLILSTVHTAKGRECDIGITCGWDAQDIYEKNVGYVALSRASKRNMVANDMHDLVKLLKEEKREEEENE